MSHKGNDIWNEQQRELEEEKEPTMRNWRVTGTYEDGDVEVYQFYYTQSAIETAKDLQNAGASVAIERIRS